MNMKIPDKCICRTLEKRKKKNKIKKRQTREASIIMRTRNKYWETKYFIDKKKRIKNDEFNEKRWKKREKKCCMAKTQ